MLILDYFNSYVSKGLQVIPLFPYSKQPLFKGWNKNWNEKRCRSLFSLNPMLNMGLLLGCIVDVEGDTQEANNLLFKLIGDYPHPMYSSSKSVHHLFLNPDPDLTAIRFGHIEFRANLHQSVLPPSKHRDGVRYSWLKGTCFPVPNMPEDLLNFYHGYSKKRPGIIRPWCSLCGKRRYIHKKRYSLECEAFNSLGYKWQCHQCRECDVRNLCKKIRKKNEKGISRNILLGN